MSKLTEIYNIIQIDEQLATSGQPTPEQFEAIKAAEYEIVINLASGTTQYDLSNEAEILEDLGLTYHHIPVDWENPTSADVETFFATMAKYDDKKIYVHCIANMRVTAFTMLYRVIKQNIPLAEAQEIMHQIWIPEPDYPQWQSLIQETLAQHGIEDV